MDPIYYPLEMPVNGEPIALPRIEMGGPVDNTCCGIGNVNAPGNCGGGCGCGNGLCMQDLLILLNGFGDIKLPLIKPVDVPRNRDFPQQKKPPTTKRQEMTQNDKKEEVKVPEEIKEEKEDREEKKVPIIPPSKKKNQKPPPKERRNWWKLAKDFVEMYNFWSTSVKYCENSKYRNGYIADRYKSVSEEIEILKEWIIGIEEPFWNEFKIFQDLDLRFKNIDSKMKIKKQSQKIIAMIKKFLENLIGKSTKLSDVPENIQKIFYKFIKEKAFYPKSYLSTFQVNRLDFHFYGGTRNMNDNQGGLILAFLIICGVTVQQILLHIGEIFREFKNLPNVIESAKFIGSLLHYLTRDTFMKEPQIQKELIALMNYYRNYHIFNEEVEKQQDLLHNNMTFNDEDQFAEFLEPESNITSFWDNNPSFIETFQTFVFGWAVRLSKLIRLKYSKSDKTLRPKKKMERPIDKTVEYDVKIGNQI